MTLALPHGLPLFPHRASLASKASLGKLAYRDQRYWLQAQWVVSGRVGPGRILETEETGIEEVERLPSPPEVSFALLPKAWLGSKLSQLTLKVNAVILR